MVSCNACVHITWLINVLEIVDAAAVPLAEIVVGVSVVFEFDADTFASVAVFTVVFFVLVVVGVCCVIFVESFDASC